MNRYCWGGRVKEDRMGMACGTRVDEEKFVQGIGVET
jgi:hypothetical protein